MKKSWINIELLDTLKKTYPKDSKSLDSIYRNHQLSKVSILVINNKNGEIENFSFSDISSERFKQNESNSRATRLYGYLMSFQKGISLKDSLISYYDFYTKKPVYQSIITPFIVNFQNSGPKKYHFSKYSKNDWRKLNRQLHIQSEFKYLNSSLGSLPNVHTNIYDLTQTFSVIQRNGLYQKPLMIRKIDSGGKNIYHLKNKVTRIIDEKTISKMKKLLNILMTQGWGVENYRKNKIIEDCIIYHGSISDNERWKIYTTDKYSIGISEINLIYKNIRKNYQKFIPKSIYRGTIYNLLLSEILNGMNLNKVKGENLKQIEEGTDDYERYEL